MAAPIRIARDDWPAVVEAFGRFFAGLGGAIEESEDAIEFNAGFTGLAVNRNGTSRSFMPLHDLRAGWTAVEFDDSAREVTLIGDGATYTYRVPPQLSG